MKKCMLITVLLLNYISCAEVSDMRITRTLESMQRTTGAAALTSFFCVGMVPEEYTGTVLGICFCNQLAYIATSIALLKHKKNLASAARILFPTITLFSFLKLSALLYESRLQQAPEIQTDLCKMMQEVAAGDQLEFTLANLFCVGMVGQCGMLCYDSLSADER